MPHNRNDKFHQHIDYIKKFDEWVKITDLLEGQHECLTKPEYLWMHSMEDPARQCDERDRKGALRDRLLREQRTRYVNYTKMVKERFVSLIMRGGLNPSEEVIELFGDDIKNVDGQDTSLEEFATQIAGDMVSYGVGYIFTDTETVNARNILEEQEAGSRPYWIRIAPMSLEDWQIGAKGEYEGFRYEYMLLEPRQSLEDEPTLVRYTTIAMMREEGYTLKTFSSVDETGHFVNHHPDCALDAAHKHDHWREENSIAIEEVESLPLATNRVSDSVLSPVVDIALKIYNKQSDLDNILHNQCYDRVFVFADLAGALGADGEPVSDSAKEVKLATNSMVVAPEGGTVTKLEPTDPNALIESIRDDIEDLFRVAFNKARTRRVDSRAPESDRTQKEIKEDLLTRILRARETLLNTLNSAVRDYAMFKNQDADFQGSIQFAQSVTEADINELSTYVRNHTDRINQYEGVRKAVDKKIISHLELPKEEELFQEIDTTKLPDPDAALNQVNAAQGRLQGLVTQNSASKRQNNSQVSKGNRRNGQSRN